MSEIRQFTINLEQQDEFEFKVRFDWPEVDDLLLDEPAPLGGQQGPNAARLIAAGVANCLMASLMYCLQKSRSQAEVMTAFVTGSVGRNEKGRMRLVAIDVEISLGGLPENRTRMERCFDLFEDFCVVTESVRNGVPVSVAISDQDGTVLHRDDGTL